MFQRSLYWWISGGVVALVVSSLGLATSWSYIKTAWLGIGQSIREATPISFDLKRLDEMIKSIEPEIRHNYKVAATLETEIEFQEKVIAKLQQEQEKSLAEMRKLREALGDQGRSEFQFAGRKYTRPEVEQDLKRRLDLYQERQAELKAQEDILKSRRENLTAIQQKISEYRRQYQQLVAQYERLQAELKLLETAQAAGSVQVDGSKLNEAKALAQEIQKRIQVNRRTIEAEQRSLDSGIPVDTDERSATERFDSLFGPTQSPKTDSPKT